MATTLSYRPDIDGLRAVAVLAVVLFHAGFAGFGGGFVGVDVFFVISGFLITRMITADRESGRFSFGRFYIRRIRRLFPALIATLALSFLCGVLLLTPHHLKEMSQSLIHAALSLSNFHFWSETGYFDIAARYKPLLHTWSLSVEEQFYLVWPALIIGLLRVWGLPVVWGALTGLGVLSLLASQYWLDVDEAAAFYLMPFRVFEFALGAGLVWLVGVPGNRVLREAATAAGLLLIAVSVFGFAEGMRFPGVAALPPCLGAVLVIYGGTAPALGRTLNNPLMVAIGRISYSLYLVHWPVIVFYKYWRMGPITVPEKLALVAASVALAAAMYVLVEKPFRRPWVAGGSLAPKGFALALAACAAAVIVPAAAASAQGWIWRLPPDAGAVIRQIHDSKAARDAIIRSPRCHLRRKKDSFAEFAPRLAACNELARHGNYVVIGDSHGADLYAALRHAYPHANFIQFTGGGCRPGMDGDCREITEVALAFLQRHQSRIDGVFLTARYELNHAEALLNLAGAVRQSGVPVVVLGPQPEFAPEPAMLIGRFGAGPEIAKIVNRQLDRTVLSVDIYMKGYLREWGIPYVSKMETFCANGDCPVFDRDGKILYSDYGHWSPAGSKHFGTLIRARFARPREFFRGQGDLMARQ